MKIGGCHCLPIVTISGVASSVRARVQSACMAPWSAPYHWCFRKTGTMGTVLSSPPLPFLPPPFTPLFPFVPSFPFSSLPPLLLPPFRSPPFPIPPLPLEVGPLTAARESGERLSSPSGPGWSPAAKRFLVHFEVKIMPPVTMVLRRFLYLYVQQYKSVASVGPSVAVGPCVLHTLHTLLLRHW